MSVLSIAGVTPHQLASHRDERGALVALDGGQGLPFELKRVFYIFDAPFDTQRGSHSVSAHMQLVCVSGSVSITCDNGFERVTYDLNTPDTALHTEPGVWILMSNFSKGAVLLVLSSQPYAETKYFDLPMYGRLAQFVGDGDGR